MNTILYQYVHNIQASTMHKKFKRHEYLPQSAVIYLNECSTLQIMRDRNKPYGIALCTKIGEINLCEWRGEQFLIDSTVKMNKHIFALFVLIGSCIGAGFPLFSFLFQAGTGGGLKSRNDSLTFFLNFMKDNFQNLKPSFVLTEKVRGQINAIRNVFCLDALL